MSKMASVRRSKEREITTTEKLIALVQDYPIFYDAAHKDHKSTRKKNKIWNEIGKELNESGLSLKKKWKNLKDTYMKYIKSSKKKGRGAKKNKKWLWADEMEYFRDYLISANTAPRKHVGRAHSAESTTASEGSASEITVDFFHNSGSENIPPEPSPNCSMADEPLDIKPLAMCSQVLQLIETAAPPHPTAVTVSDIVQATDISTVHTGASVIQPVSAVETLRCPGNETSDELDAVDSLFLAYAKTIKTFSNRRQAIAKMKIAQVIMEQELIALEEPASTYCLTTLSNLSNCQ